MDRLVPRFYKGYGDYVNSLRMLPLDKDGLIPAERRVLVTTYQIARERFVKSQKVVGNTLATWHPHGDCYSTLVQMVKQGFVEGQGNWGSNVGIEPTKEAAFRYTECKSSKFLNDIMNLIKHVPWDNVETDDKEPLYIPTIFPLCLVGLSESTQYKTGIAFGYRCLCPCYSVSDLYDRLLFLLGKKEKKIIKPVTDCTILSTDSELEDLLTKGKASITFRGKVEVDKVNCKVVLKSIPYGRRFSSFFTGKADKKKDLAGFFSSGDVGYIDKSAGKETRIVLEVRRTRGKYDLFRDLVNALRENLTSRVSFDIVVVDDKGKVRTTSVDDLLLLTYNMYKQTNAIKLNYDKAKILEEIDDLIALKRIGPFLSKYISDKSKFNLDEVTQKISNESGVPQEKVKSLFAKYRIQKLFTLNTDTSEKEKVLKEIEHNLTNLEGHVLDKYDSILKRIGD